MKQWANTVIILIVLIVFVYGIKQIAEAPDVVSLFNPEVEVSGDVIALKDTVTLAAFQLTVNQVTKQVVAAFELNNKSKTTISEVSISCDFYDNDGEFWGRGRWKIFEHLLPDHSERYVLTDRRYISHNTITDRTDCKIVDLVSSPTAGIAAVKGH